ncbi:MAG: flagellin [Geminicoccaceae bacterium]|nr:flagellin [Geminicoccaceae bacterium]
MALSGTTNTSANTALRYLTQNNSLASSSLAKLSSGSRIVKASDDAASLAVGTKIRADVTALKQAQVNTGQASSMLQVADGALSQTSDILMRLKALSVQSQSGSVSDNERNFLDKEFTALVSQIDDIAEQTKFNGMTLLNGDTGVTVAGATDIAGVHISGTADVVTGTGTASLSMATAATATTANAKQTMTFTYTDQAGATFTATATASADDKTAYSGAVVFEGTGITLALDKFDGTTAVTATNLDITNNEVSFQVGVSSADTIEVGLDDIRITRLGNVSTGTLADADGAGVETGRANIRTREGAIKAGDILDNAIAQINEDRANIGAAISRFDFASANLATSIENLDAARSTLMDVDMASEMSNFSSKQVMMQASVAMLAQANQMPQQLLRLLN